MSFEKPLEVIDKELNSIEDTIIRHLDLEKQKINKLRNEYEETEIFCKNCGGTGRQKQSY